MWWHLGDEDTGRKYPMVLVEQKYGFSRQKIIKRKNIERDQPRESAALSPPAPLPHSPTWGHKVPFNPLIFKLDTGNVA